jgi:hypothetical protein
MGHVQYVAAARGSAALAFGFSIGSLDDEPAR